MGDENAAVANGAQPQRATAGRTLEVRRVAHVFGREGTAGSESLAYARFWVGVVEKEARLVDGHAYAAYPAGQTENKEHSQTGLTHKHTHTNTHTVSK